MRTMTLRGVLALTILLALSVTTAYAQSLLQGVVLDEQNKPVEGAVIKFELKDSKIKRDVKTDKKGAYLIVGLATGRYTMTATKGDLIDTANADIKQGKATVNFTLRSATATAARKGPRNSLEAASAGALSAEDKEKEKIIALATTATEALDAWKAGRHEEAIPKLNTVLEGMPNCADCYGYLGVSYFETKQLPEAEAAFKKSLELQPTVDVYTMLIRFYISQNKMDLAEEYSKKAAALSAVLSGNAPPASAGGEAARPSGPSTETLYNQGVTKWNLKQYSEAKPFFEAAVKADSKNGDAYYMLGMANLNLGDVAAARSAFDNYLKVAPNGPKAGEVKGFLTQLPK